VAFEKEYIMRCSSVE